MNGYFDRPINIISKLVTTLNLHVPKNVFIMSFKICL